jgi:aromatic-L-amino-acid decarboxylase
MPAAEFRAALHGLADWVADYRENIENLRVSPETVPGETTARLNTAPPDQPAPFAEIFQEFRDIVLPGIVHWGHPSFLGYFGSTTTAPGILSEILAAALNISAMTWRTSPAATELETLVLDWFRQMLRLPSDFTGVVYDTASVAILHALAAARENLGLDIRVRGLCGRAEVHALRIYASEHAHSSVEKAAITLGLGESNVRRVATDPRFCMDPSALRSTIEQDLQGGMIPMAVVATVGTTSSTSVDPVRSIATICRQYGLWLHVDAAYGGAMALLPEGCYVMDGVEDADSVVVNPHKWLFVPLDFSALYVKRPKLLRDTFSLVPEYLRGDADQAEHNYMDYGIQLGRRFRALKAWMVIRNLGTQGFSNRIRENVRLARLFASWIDGDPQFETVAPVIMAVVCFSVAPPAAKIMTLICDEVDEVNRRLVDAVSRTGQAYLTHTTLNGRIAMRLAVGNVLTTERHLKSVYDLLRRELAHVVATR